MPLTLHVDAERWRTHLSAYAGQLAAPGTGLVPVVKGNGYGLGTTRLAAEAAGLHVPALAVGTYGELPAVREVFPGDLLVLSPWRPWDDAPLHDDRVVHTVSRRQDLLALAGRTAATGRRPRVVVEVLTSMLRHGVPVEEIADLEDLLATFRMEGWALHLPLSGDRLATALATAERVGVEHPLWVSHLDPHAVRTLADRTGAGVRSRVGTALWLGDRGALVPRATVVDTHRLTKGTRYGYRQRRARGDGTLLVLAGGTAHGVALAAPAAAASLRQRALALAHGGLEASGRSLSPYVVAGRRRWFAEPPHMQVSLVWLPAGVAAPDVGDEVGLDVRFTTTTFDRVLLSPPIGL